MITVAKIDTREIEDKADDTKNKAAAALSKKGGQSRAQRHNKRQQAEIV